MMWILVTGGAKRLGAALCQTLAEEGYSVVVHYNKSKKEALDVVGKWRSYGKDAAAIQGDFSSLPGVTAFVQRYREAFPETVGIINNVGEYLIRPTLKTSIEEWTHLFQVSLHTPFILSQALVPSLIQNKGQIINIGASGIKCFSSSTYSTAYTLTKQGLYGLTLALAKELAPYDVRVNMVSPGQLDISIDQHDIPMKRSGYCWEVSRVVKFLLHPDSGYITGQNIEVAGGLGL